MAPDAKTAPTAGNNTADGSSAATENTAPTAGKVASEHTADSTSAATKHTGEPQLVELVNQEAGMSTQIELKVIRNDIIEYTYQWHGGQVLTQKLQIVLQSRIAEQYCLGIAKLHRKDKNELKAIAARWKIGTTWRFKTLPLLNEKPAFIHTSCRIAIDLRKAQTQALLQSTAFPEAPVPTATIADILELQQMQRFDIMAIPAKILEERKSGTGVHIADVRLVDGSLNQTTKEYASLPLTLFFKDAAELASFKSWTCKTPVLFMCLVGSAKDGNVSVATIKQQSWWQEAAGTKSLAMAAEAAGLCGDDAALRDVAALPIFTHTPAVDYTSPMATYTACQVLDLTCAAPGALLGDATEHLYQLNHVYVPPPTKEANIKTRDDRLFARFDVWDHTKKITLAFRSKAMLRLAMLAENDTEEYQRLLATDELRHPLLASLRVHVRSKPQKRESEANATERSQTESDNVLDAVVVEAAPCTFTDIPNDSVEAIHGLIAGSAQTSDRLAVVPLDKLRPSPFYNMLADGKPVEKVLTLLHFTQRSNGKQHARGFRVITERAQDATAAGPLSLEKSYATIALCTIEKVTDFTAAKDATHMAVVSKVVAPSKPQQHAADLYIEAMELVARDHLPKSLELMRQLQRISTAQSADPATSTEVAWQQRKCRRLLRYPTQEGSV